MASDDARDRERAQTEGPVGTRAQDIRSRTEVIAERGFRPEQGAGSQSCTGRSHAHRH
jgi:hypothetical protein